MDAKYYPPPENPAQPRVFVVRSDGSGFELLSSSNIEQYMREVAVNSNARIMPVEKLTGPGEVDEAEEGEAGEINDDDGVVTPGSVK
jgi:hypothetical protein